jgi:transcriptional regulator with XRE-family HTH domain
VAYNLNLRPNSIVLLQRQLTQHDFKGIDAKTIARIESGLVKRPHTETLKRIGETLGVLPEELGTF